MNSADKDGGSKSMGVPFGNSWIRTRRRLSRRITAPAWGLMVLGFVIFVLSVFAQNKDIPIRIIVIESADDAQRILEDLKQGGDFAKIAGEKSIDPTANDGGFMGKLDPAELRPELQEALRNLHPGEFSAITKIPSGYAILQIMSAPEPVENKSPIQPWVMP